MSRLVKLSRDSIEIILTHFVNRCLLTSLSSCEGSSVPSGPPTNPPICYRLIRQIDSLRQFNYARITTCHHTLLTRWFLLFYDTYVFTVEHDSVLAGWRLNLPGLVRLHIVHYLHLVVQLIIVEIFRLQIVVIRAHLFQSHQI